MPAHVVCIGPTTAEAARAAGMTGVHEAWGASTEGIVAELSDHSGTPGCPRPRSPVRRAPRSIVPMAEADTTEHKAGFPARRLRRLRRTPALRRLVAETRLGVDDLVAPLFVREGIDAPAPIASMPGVVQHTVDSLVQGGASAWPALGLPGLILFGVPATRTRRVAAPGTPRASCRSHCATCATRWATSWS